MAFGPITSQQLTGETMETVTDVILGGSKITEDGDCSHEITRCLLLGRKAMTNLDSILKSRDITNKGLCTQSYGFSSSHVHMLELDYKENHSSNTKIELGLILIFQQTDSKKTATTTFVPRVELAAVTICSDFGAQKNKV